MKVFDWSCIEDNAACGGIVQYGLRSSEVEQNNVLRALVAAGSALTVGSFDGPHLGHKAIFSCVANAAKERGLVPGVVTFKKPLTGVKKGEGGGRQRIANIQQGGEYYMGDISTLEERLKCFESYGMKFALVVDFSIHFAKMAGSVFFDVLREKLNCRFVAEGEDFHCGRGGAFSRPEIAAYCAEHGMECCFVPPVMMGGERISSSRIRAAMANGDRKSAADMLGI